MAWPWSSPRRDDASGSPDALGPTDHILRENNFCQVNLPFPATAAVSFRLARQSQNKEPQNPPFLHLSMPNWISHLAKINSQWREEFVYFWLISGMTGVSGRDSGILCVPMSAHLKWLMGNEGHIAHSVPDSQTFRPMRLPVAHWTSECGPVAIKLPEFSARLPPFL